MPMPDVNSKNQNKTLNKNPNYLFGVIERYIIWKNKMI